MNETNLIINEIFELLKEKKLLKGNGMRYLGLYLSISHTAIYNMIKNDRLTIKAFKIIKLDENLKTIYISDAYIVNNILMGY